MWGSGYGRGPLNCGDIMTKDVTTCQLQTPLREVAEKMEDEDVGSIPVVDENDRLIGIITDRDIVCRVLAEGRDTRKSTAADAMSQDIVSVNREESIIDAIHKMGESQVRRLPVVDQNYRLRGIISMADIALEAERNLELANALEHISQPAPFRARRR
jgi:CBS domain-containing protein